MKKITFILVLSVLLSLTGCSLFSPSDNLDAVTGVLSAQTSNDDQPGTHLITDDDGEIYPVSSTRFNLSSQQYLENRVTLRGYMTDDGIFSVDGVTVLELLEKENGKASWIEYMNQKVGFKLKYYDNWEVKEFPDVVNFKAPLSEEYPGEDPADIPHDIFIVSVHELDEDETLEMFGETYANDVFGGEKSAFTEAKIGYNQMDALKLEVDTKDDVIFFLGRDELVYELAFMPNEGMSEAYERAFYEMLLEFQLVPFNDSIFEEEAEDPALEEEVAEDAEATEEEEAEVEAAPEEILDEAPLPAVTEYDYSDFSEFESGPYHFKAKYPKPWYYAGKTRPSEGVLHQYSFSDEEVTDENQFAGLDILDTAELPSGTTVELKNGQGAMKYIGSTVHIYVKVGERAYRVQGNREIEEILLKIAGSIEAVE
ncbi:hypothetical protein HOE67_00275 [Candidatus Peregrinibacteria bacterium]|jgi:hypothetical protein|nr:hypothetical protein [Candidatus Peregrinibacteria bacterium]MBT4055528.1 hypothetical protein [Candidatus Peregrinibacteria bacterium]